MACLKCNRANGFPDKFILWTICSVCSGEGEIVKEKRGKEIVVTCSHCRGKGACTRKPKIRK